MRSRFLMVAALMMGPGLLMVVGCSDNDDLGVVGCAAEDDECPPVGSDCPPKGIGREEHQGVPPEKQIQYYRHYRCKEPQLCYDLSGQRRPFILDGRAPRSYSFTLTNCSTGTQQLIIERVDLYGDERCNFSPVSDDDISTKALDPGQQGVIQTVYEPESPGEDHAELWVYSNAENYSGTEGEAPPLRLGVCGDALLPLPDAGVGGTGPDAGGSAGGDGGGSGAEIRFCEERTTPRDCP